MLVYTALLKRDRGAFATSDVILALALMFIIFGAVFYNAVASEKKGPETQARVDVQTVATSMRNWLSTVSGNPISQVEVTSASQEYTGTRNDTTVFTGQLVSSADVTGTIFLNGSWCAQAVQEGIDSVWINSDTNQVEVGTCEGWSGQGAGTLPDVNEVTLPGAIQGLTASSSASNTVLAQWNPVAGATAYTIQIGDRSPFTVETNEWSSNAISGGDTQINVRAVNGNGSGVGQEAHVFVQGPKIAQSTAFIGDIGGMGSDLNLSSNIDAGSYKIIASCFEVGGECLTNGGGPAPDLENYVDRDSNQSVGGSKTFTSILTANNGIQSNTATFSGNVFANSYYGDGSNLTGIVRPSDLNSYVTLATTQTITGAKTFSNTITQTGTGGTNTFSRRIDANAGLTSTTGAFTGHLTGTTATLSGLLQANGGITSTSGIFSGALEAMVGSFTNGIAVTGTGTFGGNVSAGDGLFGGNIIASGTTGTNTFGADIWSQKNILVGPDSTNRWALKANANKFTIANADNIPRVEIDNETGDTTIQGRITSLIGVSTTGSITATGGFVTPTKAAEGGGNVSMNVGGVGAQPCKTTGDQACQTGTANENSILFQGDGTHRKGWITGTTEGGVSAYAQNTSGTINRIFTAATTGLTIHGTLTATNASFTGNVDIENNLDVGGSLDVGDSLDVGGNLDVSKSIEGSYIVDRILPDIVSFGNNTTYSITSTSWQNMNLNGLMNLQGNRQLWVRVDYQAWMRTSNNSTGQVDAGVRVFGATTVGEDQGMYGNGSLYTSSSFQLVNNLNVTNGSTQQSGSKVIRLNPGNNYFEFRAKISGSGTKEVNRPNVTVTPLYWAE